MDSSYENFNITSYLQEVKRKEKNSNHFARNEQNRDLIKENHFSCDPRVDTSRCSSSSSFETLLPKNDFYDIDAFFDSDMFSLDGSILGGDMISLDGSILEDDEVYESKEKSSDCKRRKEYSTFSSPKGKVLDTFAFQSLKRKVNAIAEKNDAIPILAVDVSKAKKHSSGCPIQHDGKESTSIFSSSKGKVLNTFAFQSLKEKVNTIAGKNVVSTKEERTRNEAKVQISDETKLNGTSLAIEIFGKHYKIIKFNESDRGCKRNQLEIGFVGLACAYCDGSRGRAKGGRYFPSSIKTMADPNKILFSMYKHSQKCTECPSSTKNHLKALHKVYDKERATQARGSQRKFYKAIWDFLRKKDDFE
ncbi:hypothetical protein CTEN210_11765 [Chaetoceros tenuissimus]|uniref:Uncharacterized protein n=1 Tax=Chaetoceros tenuissimus TaxID=426638 RepID=A0AAD3D379_9STRA|nr:hypothetical protein CTEN210_11765 [Chaetoceros tenuissimus]